VCFGQYDLDSSLAIQDRTAAFYYIDHVESRLCYRSDYGDKAGYILLYTSKSTGPVRERHGNHE
jgi:hypothetical protein